MKKRIFRGTSTALITPYREGKIDYKALGGIIEMQISGGIKTLVVGGTTGEAATLTAKERRRLFAFARERIGGRAALVLGVGTNDTREVVARTREAAKIGCDAALVVTPYYNKGTFDGVSKHYMEVANCSDLPIIVYNVPTRTGVNLTLSQLEAFAKCEKIIGIKEAGDSMERFVKIAAFGEDLPLYSGNDSSIFPSLALGGAGVISVLSNLLPEAVEGISTDFFRGDLESSRRRQISLLGIIDAMFAETNPAPIKYAMSLIGACSAELRLPLSEPTEKTKDIIRGELAALGLIG